jgi:hypothetical protein
LIATDPLSPTLLSATLPTSDWKTFPQNERLPTAQNTRRWSVEPISTSPSSKLITSQFSVETVIELHQADAFHSEVSAYPAITVIRRGEQQRALVARAGTNASTLGSQQIRQIIAEADKPSRELVVQQGISASSVSEWFKGTEPWPCFNPERLALLKYFI